MARYEYREVDLHSIGGRKWFEHLNALGAEGWRCVWFDRDTTQHVIAIVEREIPDDEKDKTTFAAARRGK